MNYHLCGCYYLIDSQDYYTRFNKHYLPLLDSSAHSTILSTTSRTVLKQTFTNPSTTNLIKECIYTFPLYDGVSVVSFTCRIGKKVLIGLVKEKFKAKQIFEDAVAKGETAGLLEQAPESSDVFSTKLGNIPAGESVTVEITYIGELKSHEAEGIRFTIPTSIAPRYGTGPTTAVHSEVQLKDNQGIEITVDVNMPEGSFIKGVQSPSHPIAVSMGTVSTATKADPTMSKASATLSLGSAALEKDFVLIVQAKDVGIPKAILETHPTIPNHRALMATLVPKFSLPPSRPEIVFVADRSGSMNNNIEMLVSAMKVFLKSIPIGVKFNICSFGSNHTFLWHKSKAYTAETLAEATKHLSTFSANMGGTETFGAIKATVDRRFSDIPLEIMLLTDGDIWNQNQLFEYLNRQVEETKGQIRVFPLGIGNGVSHALIEGLARAGNGFTSAVQAGERLDNSVVRMLRGALSPHITDYTLEIKYEQQDDDFEVIEKVTEGMRVLLSDDISEKPEARPTISLFDTTVDPEKDSVKGNVSPYAHLPKIPFPNLHQAPHKIPSLFTFSRTSVYLLLSPETIQRNPTAVILRATSNHGPLALEFPVEVLSTPGKTIHQLAAKKAVQDLEEGRGWIYDAKDQKGKLIKDRYPSCFQELVEKEAVRLGEKFQIAGKWTSFVAVAANAEEIAARAKQSEERKKRPGRGAILDGEAEVDDDDSVMDKRKRRSGRRNQFLDVEAEVDEDSFDMDFTSVEGSSDVLQDFDFDSFIHQEIATGIIAEQEPPVVAYRDAPGGAKHKKRYADLKEDDEETIQVFRQLKKSTAGRSNDDRCRAAMPEAYSPPAYSPASPASPAYSPSSPTFGQPQQIGISPFGSQSQRPQQQQQLMARASPSLFGSTRSAEMNRIVQVGEKLDSIVDRSEPLSSHSKMSYTKAKKSGPSNPFAGAVASVGGLFGSSKAASPPPAAPQSRGAPPAASGGLFGGFGGAVPSYGSSNDAGSRSRRILSSPKAAKVSSSFSRARKESASPSVPTPAPANWSAKSPTEKLHALISLQSFEGSWPSDNDEISAILGFDIGESPKGGGRKVWVTMVVLKFLEIKMADEEGTWGLVGEKARGWLEGLGLMDLGDLETEAGKFVEAN